MWETVYRETEIVNIDAEQEEKIVDHYNLNTAF